MSSEAAALQSHQSYIETGIAPTGNWGRSGTGKHFDYWHIVKCWRETTRRGAGYEVKDGGFNDLLRPRLILELSRGGSE